MKDIAEQIADGDINSYEIANRLTVAEAFIKFLKQDSQVCRSFLASRMVSKDKLTGIVGEVSYRDGHEDKPYVKDEKELASWLYDNGEEDSVEQVLVPKEYMFKPDVLMALIKSHGGEAIPGIDFKGGAKPSVSIKVTKDWQAKLKDAKVLGQAKELLGIESGEEQQEEDGEEYSWDRI
ncbi:hypothetical protein [Bifidobacterium aquikefiri]|uniref:hypothetical protein n=1 Tax=Bifidobacterium aquikefiri TaxID=1653207 RepID=UPI0039E8696E